MDKAGERRPRCRGRRFNKREPDFFSSLFPSSNLAVMVGQSSIINPLPRRLACPVYNLSNQPIRIPSITMYPHEVVVKAVGNSIRPIDTPGPF